MVGQAPQDTPFGLEANVAAGLAYVIPLLGGIVMLAGGGTNKLVKWAATQSIVWCLVYIAVEIVLGVLNALTGFHLMLLFMFLGWLVMLAAFVIWLWTFISAFMGKDVRIPGVADWTANLFKSVLA